MLYFHFDGERVYFSESEIPDSISYRKIILKNSKEELIVSTNKLPKKRYIRYIAEPENKKMYIAVLKSNIQKCTRRNDLNALPSACLLYHLDHNEFFRRIPVIMIEDSYPCKEAIVRFTWYMCASSLGYLPNKRDYWYCMNVVKDMISQRRYLLFDSNVMTKYADSKHNCGVDDDFVNALEVRKNYGMMVCDIAMLSYHQYYWTNYESKHFYRTISLDIFDFDTFNISHILLESLDKHSASFINKKFPDSVLCIWVCEGRINVKKPLEEKPKGVSPELKRQFNEIIPQLNNLRLWIISKLLKITIKNGLQRNYRFS